MPDQLAGGASAQHQIEIVGVRQELEHVLGHEGAVGLGQDDVLTLGFGHAPSKGMAVALAGLPDNARITLQIDIGFGDVVEPAPVDAELPVMLALPAPKLRAYPAEVVIAEKFQAMVQLGIANSRMKDFFDIWILSREQVFQMSRLRGAIVATFGRRKTVLSHALPTALTKEFLKDAGKIKLWKAFLKRIQLPDDHVELEQAGDAIAEFVMPVLRLSEAQSTDMEWPAGGSWKKPETINFIAWPA